MTLLKVKPKFLYPNSRQFPFDEVSEKIVRALEKRNWKVPGIEVKFDTYGSGEAKYKMVRDIIGDNFKMHFCRNQGNLNKRWNDVAALHECYIPKQGIDVYEDESGPRYYYYVGDDWEKDKKWFMNSIKVHSKLRKEPRRYLRYDGDTYKGRATNLIHNKDLGREYSPIGNEPTEFNLNEKFDEFKTYLEENVLAYILKFPEQEKEEEPDIELIPYNGPWERLYSLCYGIVTDIILTGKEDHKKLPKEDRGVYFGGSRLVNLGVKNNSKFPEEAYDGFIWCDVNTCINQNSNKRDLLNCVVEEMGSSTYSNHIVCIKLKYANDIFVADNSKFDQKRNELFEAIAPRQRLTDEELDEAYAERGATLVPITSYKGGYKEPIVLIRRELDFDEIEWIS